MIGLFVAGALAFAAFVVLAVLAMVAGLLGFLISLPFRILGLGLKLAGLVLALPLLIVVGLIVAAVAGGAVLVTLLACAMPVLLVLGVVWFVFWLMRDRRPASGATIHS